MLLQIGFTTENALVITADGIEGQGPGVALARNCALQKANDSRFRFSAPIFNRAGKGGNVWKIGALGEESHYFDVGIYAVFELAIEFKEKFVLEKHRRITLLAANHIRTGNVFGILCECRTDAADKLSVFPAGTLSI